MAWTDPAGHVFATGEIVTAATLNTYVKDNLIDLDRRTSPVTSEVATGQTTTSTAYTDLATVGPAATVTIGSSGKALVSLFAISSNNTAGEGALMSYAVSGATTVSAADGRAVGGDSGNANDTLWIGSTHLHESLTAGSNTFTAKYRVGTGTGTWTNRRIIVTPLGS